MNVFDSIDCCGDYTPTKREIQFSRSMIIYKDIVASLFHNAVADNVFGKTRNLDKLGMINFLTVYLDIIQAERDDYIAINGTDRGRSYYIDRYKIDCIARKMACIGVDIRNMLTVYDLYPFTDAIKDGINYMIVESLVPPINRIR